MTARHRAPKPWLRWLRTGFLYLVLVSGIALVILAAVAFFAYMGWGNPA